MSMNTIDAATLQRIFLAGAYNINNHKEYINELNVFPVPDGDTGTNMSLTIMAAAAEVQAIENPTIDSLAKAISGGSLRGARGNSGVILSQLFRGFCKDIKGKTELDVMDLASGFSRGVETAYKAVMKPKEGTILTVAKGIAEQSAMSAAQGEDIIEFSKSVIEYGDEVLAGTPELLPVLKEAGVVDSGGQGLMEVLKGMFAALKGETITLNDDSLTPAAPKKEAVKTTGSGNDSISTADIKFGYCTEFIIMLEKEFTEEDEDGFKEYLLSIGDSLVVVSDDEIVKVHVHTNHPGLAFEKALTFGSLTRMKIDNMREEHHERVIMEQDRQMMNKKEEEKKNHKEPAKKYGFIAVSVGEGINQILKDIGVDYIIEGGQTMNPSTEDILSAIEHVNAENIFILPNNKNIVLAANQAADICNEKNIIVIPSASVPQGISAVIGFVAEAEPDMNKDNMIEAMQAVKSGEVTYAVRDTTASGKTIKTGDIMGISDEGICAVGSDIQEVTTELIQNMTDEDSGLISIYYGSDVTKEDAEKLEQQVSEKYPDLDVDLNYGGQPIYYYMVSVE